MITFHKNPIIIGLVFIVAISVCSIFYKQSSPVPVPQTLHPLADNYQYMKENCTFIQNLVGTKDASDQDMINWLGDVEVPLDRDIVNSSTQYSSDNLINIATITFNPDVLSLNPPRMLPTKNQNVYHALIAAYGRAIYSCIEQGKPMPPEVENFLSYIKGLLTSEMVIASPPPGSYQHPLVIKLSGFTQGATYYYRTDGGDPTTGGIKYKNGIKINKKGDIVIKAVANKKQTNSNVVEFQYNIK